MLFAYRIEPLRPALLLILVEVVFAVVVPSEAWRYFSLLWLTGPLAWLVLQVLRRGCGVRVDSERLEVQSAMTRKTITIPVGQVQGYWLMPSGQLALAYLQPRPLAPGDPDPRPARRRLYVTAAMADRQGLGAALAALPAAQRITQAELRLRIRTRRTRRMFLLAFGIVIALPIVIVLTLHFFSSLGVGVGL